MDNTQSRNAAAAAASTAASIAPNQGSITSGFKSRVMPMEERLTAAKVNLRDFLKDLDLEVCGGGKGIGTCASQRGRVECAKNVIAQVDAALTSSTGVVAMHKRTSRLDPKDLLGIGKQFAN